MMGRGSDMKHSIGIDIGKPLPFLCFFFLVWKDGKCMFPHLGNCCAAGMGQGTGILFLGLKKP